MRLIGKAGPWGWNELLLAAGGEIFRVGIRGEVTEEMDCEDIAESWGEIYCRNFSMVVSSSLVFLVLVKVLIKKSPLRLSLEGGFGLNSDFNCVSIFLFNYL